MTNIMRVFTMRCELWDDSGQGGVDFETRYFRKIDGTVFVPLSVLGGLHPFCAPCAYRMVGLRRLCEVH